MDHTDLIVLYTYKCLCQFEWDTKLNLLIYYKINFMKQN